LDALLKFTVVLNGNEFQFDAFLDSELEDSFVLECLLSLYVAACRFEAELPWAIYSCVFLHRIVGSTIVSLHTSEMCSCAEPFERGESNGFFEVEEELDVNRTFLAFLYLPVNIAGSSFGEP